MSVEIKTTNIEPLRQTFDHIEVRIGKGKAATRYQEAVHDFQATQNFHYRPTWDPAFDLFDIRRTRIRLDDFDQLIDPRQYYYAPYTLQRARQQEAQDNNFGLIEKRKLFEAITPEWQDRIEHLVLPLRHAEWGANTNNCYISAYGYGAPFTSAALMQAMDRLGIAQYLTRIALALEGGQQMLDRIKVAWLDHPDWQPMRHLMEDAMVTKDWFELHLIQNFLLDGAVFPFAYVHVDQLISAQAGIGYGLATEFMRDWYAESIRWTDAALKVVVKFSDENRALLNSWVMAWEPRVREALAPLANAAFGANAAAITEAIFAELSARRVKLGLAE